MVWLTPNSCDPRIHAVYFCPQLYKYDADKKLIPLQGEEMGQMIAQALASGVAGLNVADFRPNNLRAPLTTLYERLMLLKSCPLYNRSRFSLREPGPDQVPIPRRCPDEVGVVIIHDQLWRAVGGKL